MRDFELNVENEAARVMDRVKRVYGRHEGGNDGLFCCFIHTN